MKSAMVIMPQTIDFLKGSAAALKPVRSAPQGAKRHQEICCNFEDKNNFF
jgi:hypothetical protein